MIIDFIFKIIFAPLKYLIAMLPNVSSPPTPGTETWLEIASYSAYFFPMDLLVFIIANWLFWYSAHMAWAIIEWVYKKIPGVS
jgi:hypothetical protein